LFLAVRLFQLVDELFYHLLHKKQGSARIALIGRFSNRARPPVHE